MKASDLEGLEKSLNDLKKTIRKLGMARSNLHDIDIALSVVGRVSEKVRAKEQK